MNKSIIILSVFLICPQMLSAQGDKKSTSQLTVMSYNIRFDNPADGVSSWDNRKVRVASLLGYYHPQVFGLQEALLRQIRFLEENLPDYEWVGVGRDDGVEKGEYSPVFYDRSLFELKEWGTFWLSDDPDNPSTGWDAALPRICTWVRLLRKNDNQEIYFFNTHFDHRGEKARLESSKLIISKIKELGAIDKVVLCGDFNQTPESPGYAAITNNLLDARTISKTPAYGPEGTFSGFTSGNELGERIDHLFVSMGFVCEKFRTITDQDGLLYPSDHLPIYAIITW